MTNMILALGPKKEIISQPNASPLEGQGKGYGYVYRTVNELNGAVIIGFERFGQSTL